MTVRSVSTSPDITNEPTSYELQIDFLYQTEENDQLGTTSDGEQPEIEESSTCMKTDPSYAQTIAQPKEGNMHGMVEEDI